MKGCRFLGRRGAHVATFLLSHPIPRRSASRSSDFFWFCVPAAPWRRRVLSSFPIAPRLLVKAKLPALSGAPDSTPPRRPIVTPQPPLLFPHLPTRRLPPLSSRASAASSLSSRPPPPRSSLSMSSPPTAASPSPPPPPRAAAETAALPQRRPALPVEKAPLARAYMGC